MQTATNRPFVSSLYGTGAAAPQWLQIGTFAFVTKLAGFEYTKFVHYDELGDLPVLKAENAGPNGFHATEFSRVASPSYSPKVA